MKKNRCLTHLRAYFGIALFMSAVSAFAQGIKVGEKCPDILINHIINYPVKKGSLSSFAGKPLLLDFWFSTCTACIDSFNKMDSLQKQYGSTVQMLLVNHESEEKARSVFLNVKRLNNVSLPSIVSDSILKYLFPHRTAPHEIWIDKNGIVKAITGYQEVTRENLEAFAKGQELNLPRKTDNMEYAATQPLARSTKNEYLLQYFCITTHQPELSGSLGILPDKKNGRLKVIANDVGIKELYGMAFGRWATDFHPGRILLDIKDSLNHKPVKGKTSNLYCYDYSTNDTSRSHLLRQMRNHLDNYFQIHSTMEKRKMTCVVLRRTSSIDKLATGTKSRRGDLYFDKGKMIVDNVKLQPIIENIFNYGRYCWSPYPFIDETGYTEGVTLVLPEKFTDINEVNACLSKYDLLLTLEERIMDTIVLEDDSQFDIHN